MSRPHVFTNEELALAYELHEGGCCWKRIAVGLGCDHHQLYYAVRYVVEFGLGGH